jgi:hypothetical protein
MSSLRYSGSVVVARPPEALYDMEFLPAGITGFGGRYGDDADAQIANRTDAARRGIPVTLAAIKKTAEERS